MTTRCEQQTCSRAFAGMVVVACLMMALSAAGYTGVEADESAIHDAIGNASAGDEIRVQAGDIEFSEVQAAVDDLTISGGWNSDYSQQTPGTTILRGDGYAFRLDGDGTTTVEGFTFYGRRGDSRVLDSSPNTPETAVFVLRNNVFWECEARWGLLQTPSSVVAEGNIFAHNESAESRGNILYSRSDGDHMIATNNIFYNNLVDIALLRSRDVDAFVTNNIMVGNTVQDGAVSAQHDDLSMSHNLFWDNDWDGENDEGLAGDWPDSLAADPLFFDAAESDFRLMPGSPAIAAADDGGILGARDLPGTGVFSIVEVAPRSRQNVSPGGSGELGPVLLREGYEDQAEFQWYKNGDLLDGETGPGFFIDDATEGDAGTYTVVVSYPDIPDEEFSIVVFVVEVGLPGAGGAGLLAASGLIVLAGVARTRSDTAQASVSVH